MKQLSGALVLIGFAALFLGYSSAYHWLELVGGLMVLVGPIFLWISNLASTGVSAALMSNPNSAKGHYLRANTYRTQNATDLAIEAYCKAIELDPRFAEAYNNRGLAYQSQGQLELAISDWTKSIELDPKLAPAYLNRGVARASRREPELTIADCSKALELSRGLQQADRARAHYFRGEAYRAMSEPELAVPDILNYLELKPLAAERSRLRQWIIEQGHGSKLRPTIEAKADKGKIRDSQGDDFDSWKAKQQGNKSAG